MYDCTLLASVGTATHCVLFWTTAAYVGSNIRVVYISLVMLPAKSLTELAGILYSCGYAVLARYMQKGFIRFQL